MIHPKARKPRRGLTMIAVLVCLLVMMLLGAALLRVALQERDGNRDQERRLQAEWLVESGLERARARLAADAGYAGETWPISAADLGLAEAGPAAGAAEKADRASGVVTISVDRPAGASGRRRVRVQADYPRDGTHPSRHSQERFIDLEPQKTGATP
jgi:type II secretory pathway pseudopilin PulG